MQLQTHHNSQLSNERGSILLNAIVTTIVIAIISGALLQQSLTTLKTLRLPRVKSVMSSVEGALRHTLLQPTSYQGCNSVAGIIASCTLPIGVITRLDVTVPGCDPAPCGVQVIPNPVPTAAGFDPAAKKWNGTIVYNGTEVAVKPRTLSIDIPEEVLVSATVNCPDSAPIFGGFDGDGKTICRAINTTCPAGQFLAGFNSATLAPDCQPIPSNNLSCPGGNNQYITGMTWGGAAFSINCTNRPAPSTQWPF
jgi:hypothetical protein